MDSEEWIAQQCADEWGVQLKTWHGYVAKGAAPAAKRRVGRTPVWDATTVRTYPRPGQGARRDIVAQEEQ